MIRDARPDDLESLVQLERRCFDTDRLASRSFRRLLKHGNDDLIVVETEDGRLLGYILVLYRKNTSMARLYSVAIDPDSRGQRLGERLVVEAQQRALEKGATRMRLEVRADNDAAQALYCKLGYRVFGAWPDYYEDHQSAVRMEKRLAPNLARGLTRVPWYPQTLDFTCGPACLMMAMKALDPDLILNRRLEIQLWREATTVFMTSGVGGCGVQGLALAAWRRGFRVRISLSDQTEMFIGSVRSEGKKEVIRLVEQDFAKQLRSAGVQLRKTAPGVRELQKVIAAGAYALLLISSYRLHGDRAPHWVLLTAADDHFLYINDPFTDPAAGRTEMDCIGIPIAPPELERMTRLGRARHHACLIIEGRDARSSS